ncbi:MAG: hypothetical protein QF666_15700 [Alphaproteobacteria bacterium]|jgi:hypothetical protein|nr:hypothetical protein [Alphaproteobacteria bacterium]
MKFSFAAAGILMLAFLAIDLVIPLGVAAGVPYIAVVLTAWWMADRRSVFVLAGISTLFVIIGFFFSQDAGTPWMVFVNRALAILAIWTTAALLLMAKRSNERQEELVGKRTRELRESEARLLEAQRIANIGSWQQTTFGENYESGGLSWSDETYRILACSPGNKHRRRNCFLSAFIRRTGICIGKHSRGPPPTADCSCAITVSFCRAAKFAMCRSAVKLSTTIPAAPCIRPARCRISRR